jgi:UDP-2,3-diacylglucosamine pyrophosphatase LpxH
MTIIGKRIAATPVVPPTLPLEAPPAANDGLRATAHQGLTRAFQAALRLPFDDSSRFVFFSDCHRGSNDRTDVFAPNKGLFRQALDHYLRRGFTYVEVGDGDELWMNPRFSDVQRAHRPIFDLLHQFDRRNRLHLLEGNHDVLANGRHNAADDGQDRDAKGGLGLREGLVLEYTRNGQEIVVLHGHQADFGIDPGFAISRFVVRHVWRRLQELGFGTAPIWAKPEYRRSWPEQQIMNWLQGHKRKIERRIYNWLEACEKAVICGHTHFPHFAAPGTLPYFNAGSCVIPGHITGLEIQNGLISLVKWTTAGHKPGDNGHAIRRELVAPPRSLAYLY